MAAAVIAWNLALFLLASVWKQIVKDYGMPPILDRNLAPTSVEVESMACVLEGQHGFFAAGIAEFFSTYHAIAGDCERSRMWTCVAQSIRDRESARIAHR